MNSTIQNPYHISGPLNHDTITQLRAGMSVLYSGTVYTARDAAHKRIVNALKAGKQAPFDLKGACIYYAGPTPARPGKVIGSIGPTSSYRMDPYTPQLLDFGLCACIGKGERSGQVIDAIVRNKAVYFAAIGGAAAYMAQCVLSAECIAYEDLGTEAIYKLELENMPLTVAIDSYGSDIYKLGPKQYFESLKDIEEENENLSLL